MLINNNQPKEKNKPNTSESYENLLNLQFHGFIPSWLPSLIMRIALAVPFWKSGILKWDGFLHLNETTIDLFNYEFMIHLPWGTYPFPNPPLVALMSACFETIIPVLLVTGLATRIAALGVLLMTCIIEITIPEGWPVHLTWGAMSVALIYYGGGTLSLDHIIKNHFQKH